MKKLFIILFIISSFSCSKSPIEPNTFTFQKNVLQNVNGNEIMFLGTHEETWIEPNHLLRFEYYLDIEVNEEYYQFQLNQNYYHTQELCFQIINISNNELVIQL
jgi:hypothetical protein